MQEELVKLWDNIEKIIDIKNLSEIYSKIYKINKTNNSKEIT